MATARTHIDAGEGKTFAPGDTVDLPSDELDKLREAGALEDEDQGEQKEGEPKQKKLAVPGVPDAPPGSPPPDAPPEGKGDKKKGQPQAMQKPADAVADQAARKHEADQAAHKPEGEHKGIFGKHR